jgi:hypothetical protein
MKPNHPVVFLSLLVVLALLLTAFLPVAVSASSDSYIELSKISGSAGTSITISGYDFTEDYFYYVFFDGTYKAKGSIDENGEFTKSFTIPSSANPGETYEIAVFASETARSGPDYTDDFDESAYANFDVTEIYIQLDYESGKAGDSIEIYGYGFSEDYYYYVFFDETYKSKGNIDEYGEFTKTLTIPSSVDAGETYEIRVFASESSNSSPSYNDDYDESATADFKIDEADPFLEIDSYSGKAGDTFKLSGSDFGSEKTITVYWDETKIGPTFSASPEGEFSEQEYTVPETPYGIHTIKVMNSAGTFYTLEYSVDPKISLSNDSVDAGNSITVSGSGFEGSSTLTFYLDSTALETTGKTSSSGTLSSTSVLIPDSGVPSGDHVIEVQDASGNSATANINISIPEPVATPSPAVISTPANSPPVQNNPVQNNPGQNNSIPNGPDPGQNNTAGTDIQVTAQTVVPAANQPVQENQPEQPQPTAPAPSGLPFWVIILIVIASILVVLLTVSFIIRARHSQR